jgi:peptidyl-prolyl cis-trans isomerase C
LCRLGINLSNDEKEQLDEAYEQILANRKKDSSFIPKNIDPKAWKLAQQNRMTISKLITREVLDKIPISDNQVESYYRQHKKDFNIPEQIHARQILTDSPETANSLLAQIRQGGDFVEIAKQNSLSPDAERGGDLGFFDERSYPAIFAETCKKLKIGETSNVVHTDYGYQIFQLLERKPPEQIPLDAARDQIRQFLKQQEGEGVFIDWLAKLQKGVAITIDDTAVGRVSLEKTN